MKNSFFILAVSAAVFALCCACTEEKPCGIRSLALDESSWEVSEWISVKDAPVVTDTARSWRGLRAADGASWFVTDISNEKPVKSVRWMTTGLGVYSLYINGRPVGEEFLKPGFTHFAKTRRSFTYDITDAFRLGKGAENRLSAQVTPGWWADRIVTPGNHAGMIGKKCAFRSVLELAYEDGSTALFGTDTLSWKAGVAGPVVHAAIYDGEEYDARILPGYATTEKLSVPEVNREFTGAILPSDGGEIYLRHDLALKPVEAYTWKDTLDRSEQAFGKVRKVRTFAPDEEMLINEDETLVIDFGQNCSAVPAFVFRADEGTRLSVLPAEILNDGNGAFDRGMDGPEGSVHRTNLRLTDDFIRLDYTFGPGKGWAEYTPQCPFFGYRYLSLSATAPVRIRQIRSIPVSSIVAQMETGHLRTGNESINQLISNTIWGQRSNYLSVPTDCPQRNERLGWMADTQVFAETGTFFADTDGFFHKWMQDVRDSQKPGGSFPGVCPPGIGGRSYSRIGWSDAGVIVPWTVWKQFADTDIIDACWESMERYMDYLERTRFAFENIRKDCGGAQYADWLSYEALESSGGGAYQVDGKGKKHPLPDAVRYWDFLGGCYWLSDAEMMADMAAAAGRDAGKYRRMAGQAREYLREFLDGNGLFKTAVLNTMQTPALFALRAGLVEGEAREAMKARLRENFARHDGCLQTGFLGTSILMSTLTDNGMADIAWDLLFQRKNPSWLYSVDNGATTIWERWNSYTLEKGMGPKGMNSFNHYAYGCVCEWIWETAAGIAADPARPGFRHIVMRPVPDRRLGSINAQYRSAAGLIKSAWHYEGEEWVWNFTVPEGAEATVTLPGESGSQTYGSGSYEIRKSL